MRSKSTKAKKQTGARKKVASKAAASKRKIPAGRVGTITVKMPRSMWALLIEVGEKVYTKAARGKRDLNSKYANPICLILADGNKEAAAALQNRVIQAQRDFLASAGDSVKFVP
jgi:hypothetical protein